MINSTYIRTNISAFLLAVLSLAIMPKRFLHNAFARHIDSQSKTNNDKPYQLSTAGYNCDQDNIVAESPFEGAAHIYENNLPFVFTTYRIDNFSFLSIQEIYSRFRGPPMIV